MEMMVRPANGPYMPSQKAADFHGRVNSEMAFLLVSSKMERCRQLQSLGLHC